MRQILSRPVTSRRGRWACIALIAAFGTAVGGWWYVRARANWGVVVPGRIYRSAQLPRYLIRGKLQDNAIRLIIFLSREPESDGDVAAERRTAADLGVRMLDYPMRGDGASNPEFYPAVLGVVCRANQEGQAVLIHCHSGAQRTSGVVAAYRVLIQGWPPQQAYDEMLRYGFDRKNNTELIPFLNEHMKEWADALVAQGILPREPSPLPQFHP